MPATARRGIWIDSMQGAIKVRLVCCTVILLCVFLAQGCALFKKDSMSRSDDILMQEGVDAFNRGSYKRAIDRFQAVKDRYPFSPHVLLAEQKIADAHYLRKEYPEAVYAYQDFEKLHPRNPIIPYIIYQIGICYYEQVPNIDQDQEYTRKAAAEFHRLIKTYPQSPYAIRAENRLNQCLKRLAQHELYVGKLYFRMKQYHAALERFKGVILNFPDQGEYQEALVFIAKCDERILEMENRKSDPKES